MHAAAKPARISLVLLLVATVGGALLAALVASLLIAFLVTAGDPAAEPVLSWAPRMMMFFLTTHGSLALLCGVPWTYLLLREPNAPRWRWGATGASAGLTGAALLYLFFRLTSPQGPVATAGAVGVMFFFGWAAGAGLLSATFARLILRWQLNRRGGASRAA
ncbi:MAG: hypothetical protein ACOY45_14770 [Pseudomonadota bacterium]